MNRNAVAASPRSSRRNHGGGGRVVNRDRKTKRIRIGSAGGRMHAAGMGGL